MAEIDFSSLSFVVFQASKNNDDYQKSLESFRVKLFSVLPYSKAEEKKTIYTIISHTHPFHVGAPPNNRQQKKEGKIFHWSKEKAATRAKVFEEMEMILVIVFYAVENGILAQLFGLVLIKIYCEPERELCVRGRVFFGTRFSSSTGKRVANETFLCRCNCLWIQLSWTSKVIDPNSLAGREWNKLIHLALI